MKLLILISCLMAAASAGYVNHADYAYPYNHYGVDASGAPIDEPVVAAAKAQHAADYAHIAARNGDVAVVAAGVPVAYGGSVAYDAHYGHYAAPYGHYAGPQHIPVIGPNGVPVDEPAVSAARANHAAAHVEAKVRNGDIAAFVAAAPVSYAAPVAYAGSVAAHGVPLDTPEVAAAKASHFAAHVEAKARNGVFHPLVHYRKRRGILHGYAGYGAPVAYTGYGAPLAYAGYGAPVAYAGHYATHYAGAQHVPVIGANGVPVDEPAVAAARAEHAAAHIEAKARNGDVAVFAGPAAYAGHVAVAAPYGHYAGPQHIPVIGANGVPVDEPAVVAARASHAASHVEAKVRNGDVAVVGAPYLAGAPVVYSGYYGYVGGHVPVIGANGVPVDEPAVAVAKAAHAAAHAEAKARNGDLHVVAPVVQTW